MSRRFDEYDDPQAMDDVLHALRSLVAAHRDASTFASRLATEEQDVRHLLEEDPPECGAALPEVMREFEDRILSHSVPLEAGGVLGQSFMTSAIPSVVGETLATMLNVNVVTRAMAPAGTAVERCVARWLITLLAMPADSFGSFLPGGALSNLLGLSVARHAAFGDAVRETGMPAHQRGVIVCSDGAHYSIVTAANLLGIGKQNVVRVATNRRKEMEPEALRRALVERTSRGEKIVAVVATLGVTETGGFDPLQEIVEIAKQYGAHVHVDAAMGGGFAFASTGKVRLAGIERADTLVWDLHKTLPVPVACSLLVARDAGSMRRAFSHDARYLFGNDEEPEDGDGGLYTMLCSKRFHALALWVLWKTYGTRYFRRRADEAMELALWSAARIASTSGLRLAFEPVAPVVCFEIDEPSRAGAPRDRAGDDPVRRQGWIEGELMRRGIGRVGSASVSGRPHFRLVFTNPATTPEAVESLLGAIVALAAEYERRARGIRPAAASSLNPEAVRI
jgi:glutamate/tyrosine decarboxylase-like PLP-dependent enzyme